MKQHITPEQLNKLSPFAKKKLRDWWNPKHGDLVFWLDTYVRVWHVESVECQFHPDVDEDVLPLLSIGQMIDFIEHIDIPHPIYEQASPGRDFMDYDLMALPGNKWCNKLWGTVVFILGILEDGGST